MASSAPGGWRWRESRGFSRRSTLKHASPRCSSLTQIRQPLGLAGQVISEQAELFPAKQQANAASLLPGTELCPLPCLCAAHELRGITDARGRVLSPQI